MVYLVTAKFYEHYFVDVWNIGVYENKADADYMCGELNEIAQKAKKYNSPDYSAFSDIDNHVLRYKPNKGQLEYTVQELPFFCRITCQNTFY